MNIRILVLSAATIIAIPDCRSTKDPLSELATRLETCDYSDACAQSVKGLESIPADLLGSGRGIRARLAALRIGIHALAGFPPGNGDFLRAAGIRPETAHGRLAAEARALDKADSSSEAADAQEIVDFLGRPGCKGFLALDQIRDRRGRFEDSAFLAQFSVLAQILASATPEEAHETARLARDLVGCTLSDRASSAVVMMEMRNRLYDLVESCPDGEGMDAVIRTSCSEARKLAETRALSLPLPDPGYGDLGGATLPAGMRGLGRVFTPPWVIVLAAGRVALLEQTVVSPRFRQVPEQQIRPLLDLRTRHRPEDLVTELTMAFENRRHARFEGHAVAAVAVDRASTTRELLEVLDALLAVSDGIPFVAVMPPGGRTPVFLPINFRFQNRVLFDCLGVKRIPRQPSVPVQVTLDPFSLTVQVGSRVRTGEFTRFGQGSTARPDLRAAYQAAVEAIEGADGSQATLTVAPAVPAGLFVNLLEVLSSRVPPNAVGSPEQFENAVPLRRMDGMPEPLLPVVVVQPGE
jgi:hypothetical protein